LTGEILRKYTCNHVKKGLLEVNSNTTYGAAKKAAEHWNLKSTAGVDVYLHTEKPHNPAILSGA
jgi:hypothetical protein